MKFIHRLTIFLGVVYLFTLGPSMFYKLSITVFGPPPTENPTAVETYWYGFLTELLWLFGLFVGLLLLRFAWRCTWWVFTGKFWDPGELIFKK